MNVFSSRKDLHLAVGLPSWGCLKQNASLEVPWNTEVVWVRLPVHDSMLGSLWSTLTPGMKLSGVPDNLLDCLPKALDFVLNSLYAVRFSKDKFKISEISKRPQDESRLCAL